MALNVLLEKMNDDVRITLKGELDASVAEQFKEAIERASSEKPKRLVIFMNDLEFMASAGLRVLIYAKQKMGTNVSIYVIGCKGPVRNTLEMSGFHHSVYMQDSFAG